MVLIMKHSKGQPCVRLVIRMRALESMLFAGQGPHMYPYTHTLRPSSFGKRFVADTERYCHESQAPKNIASRTTPVQEGIHLRYVSSASSET